jgi:hypothetical protein
MISSWFPGTLNPDIRLRRSRVPAALLAQAPVPDDADIPASLDIRITDGRIVNIVPAEQRRRMLHEFHAAGMPISFVVYAMRSTTALLGDRTSKTTTGLGRMSDWPSIGEPVTAASG